MNLVEAQKLKEMLIYGGEVLNSHKDEVNALNVFPVPDGDTGFNMNMTMTEGLNTIKVSNGSTCGEISKDFSKGLLRGARGNSGVILSQFFRGFAEGLENVNELNSKNLQDAFYSGQKRAYSSVIKAVEGTILTVCREMVENAKFDDDIIKYMENVYDAGKTSLDNTPNLLPILKEANVVDSGGAGFLYVIEGMLANLKGIELELSESSLDDFDFNDEHNMDPEDIVFKYCTEMLLQLEKPDDFKLDEMKTYLETKGDSIVAIQDEEILKVHVHTNEPNDVFAHGLKFGEFVHVKSENMVIQAIEAQELKKSEIKEVGIVCVSSSPEMSDLFKSFTNVEIIEGGQTLNPSVEDIAKAIEKVNAKNVIVLPNNSNIIMAASSAADVVDVNVEVIKTKHLTQAVELLQTFNESLKFEDIVTEMNEMISEMYNIEVTHAIKDTSIEGVEIKENDFLGIVNGKIEVSMDNIDNLIEHFTTKFIEDEFDLITVLVGEDGDYKIASSLADSVKEQLPFTEVHIYETNQPVYHYLISAI